MRGGVLIRWGVVVGGGRVVVDRGGVGGEGLLVGLVASSLMPTITRASSTAADMLSHLFQIARSSCSERDAPEGADAANIWRKAAKETSVSSPLTVVILYTPGSSFAKQISLAWS